MVLLYFTTYPNLTYGGKNIKVFLKHIFTVLAECRISTVNFAVTQGEKTANPTKLSSSSTNQERYCQTLDSMEQ